MNRIQREELIERYLGGEMTPGEEERFLIDVASNPELRHDLKASQVIESAIRKDRSFGAIPTGKMRAELAALLVPAQHVVQTPDEPLSSLSSGFFSSWGAGVITGALALVVFYGVFSEEPPSTDGSAVHTVESINPSTIVLDQLRDIGESDPAPVESRRDVPTPETQPLNVTNVQAGAPVRDSEVPNTAVVNPVAQPVGVDVPDLEVEVPEFDQTVTEAPDGHIPEESLYSEENISGGGLKFELDKRESQD